MSPIDLREYKADLRVKRRRRRELLSLEYKKELDRRIAERVTSLYQYKNAKTVMIYASTAIEVDTFEIFRGSTIWKGVHLTSLNQRKH